MDHTRQGEIGGSGIKVILSIVILALIGHTAYVFIPIYIAVYDFNSQMDREAQYGASKSNEAIVKALVIYAAERKLPITKENLKVARSKSRLMVEADYTVPVKMLLYTHNWQVHAEYSAVLF